MTHRRRSSVRNAGWRCLDFAGVLFVLAAPSLAAFAQQLPSTVYVWPMGTGSENVMMSSLAGIVNRNTNGELLLSPNNSTQPRPMFWLDQLKARYPQVQSQIQSSAMTLINQYRNMLDGYVLYDRATNPDSINIATSIAGVTNALVVDSSTQIYAVLAGLPQVADARNMTYSQAYAQYGSQFNKQMLFHQDTGKNELLRDYAIQNRGFMYYSNTTTLNPYAANQDPHGRIYGWAPSEFDLFNRASQSNQQVVASDYSWSSSTTSKWQIPLAKQSYQPSGNESVQPGKHYVAFVMSDGDNVQWLSNEFATGTKWYGSPHRGKFNMTWDFNPTLTEMNPVAFNYIYENASNGQFKDSFVTASGAGIMFPSQYSNPNMPGLVSSISESMETADHRVLSVLDRTYNFNRLSQILDDPAVMGIMYKTYDAYYKGRNGQLQWHNGKPILSVRYSLWDGADTALSIANALNANPNRDGLNNAASFTIVNVHPWSTLGPDGTGTGDPMSNLNQLVEWLDPSKVAVVTLDEMMVHLRNNFGTPVRPPGDFNLDGSTDAADYVLWRKGLGTTHSNRHYDEWRQNYDSTMSAASATSAPAVPEPTSFALAATCFVLLLPYRTRISRLAAGC